MRPLLECWDKARNGRTMPARSDFDRLSLPRDLLANMFLLEVQHQPRRSQFRLMGTTVAEMLGEDWTGKYLDELPKANRQVINQYEETVEKQAPTEFHNQYIKIDPPATQTHDALPPPTAAVEQRQGHEHVDGRDLDHAS